MHITNQKLSFDIFTVGNLLNIFMEHDLNILMIFGIKEKCIILTHTMYCCLLLQIYLCYLWLLLCSRVTICNFYDLIIRFSSTHEVENPSVSEFWCILMQFSFIFSTKYFFISNMFPLCCRGSHLELVFTCESLHTLKLGSWCASEHEEHLAENKTTASIWTPTSIHPSIHPEELVSHQWEPISDGDSEIRNWRASVWTM